MSEDLGMVGEILNSHAKQIRINRIVAIHGLAPPTPKGDHVLCGREDTPALLLKKVGEFARS